MKIILDLALSSDGFIAKLNGDSDWVSERTEKLFKQRIRDTGCLVVGNRTFTQYLGSIYPVKGALNIVISKTIHKSNEKNVIYAHSAEESLKIATEHHCSGIVIAGGATVSKMFLRLIDEIYFSVHPILLHQGMKPFGDIDIPSNLQLLDTQDLGDNITQEHYRVEKFFEA
jgi:dihydrofolate reductase